MRNIDDPRLFSIKNNETNLVEMVRLWFRLDCVQLKSIISKTNLSTKIISGKGYISENYLL